MICQALQHKFQDILIALNLIKLMTTLIQQFRESRSNFLLEKIKLLFRNNNIDVPDIFVTYVVQERHVYHQQDIIITKHHN